jgi:hypothetical protein
MARATVAAAGHPAAEGMSLRGCGSALAEDAPGWLDIVV